MLQLDDMQLLRALGSSASLAGAARLLDLTPPAVTVRLQRIEDRIGVRLANRAARGFALTDEGQRLVQEATDILERIEAITASVSRESDRGEHASLANVSGSLRVVAPFGFGRRYVAPLLRDLHRNHPRLAISLLLAESPLAAASGADAIISIGRVKGSSWVGHFLAPNERFLCASPALARRMNRARHPSELADYPYLSLRENDDDLSRLRFTPVDSAGRRTGKALTVKLNGALSSNDGTITRD
ncbi:LysR family transcription regulator protein [Herbaspirillum seropedicae]|nr:LysR family transcription regulator protein [Herbaspirillum seropedicae]